MFCPFFPSIEDEANLSRGELTNKQNLQILSLDVCNFSQLSLMLGFAVLDFCLVKLLFFPYICIFCHVLQWCLNHHLRRAQYLYLSLSIYICTYYIYPFITCIICLYIFSHLILCFILSYFILSCLILSIHLVKLYLLNRPGPPKSS